MQTLRRELIQTIKKYFYDDPFVVGEEGQYDNWLEGLADKVLELRAFSQREDAKEDLASKSIEAAIMMGLPVEQKTVDENKLKEEARSAFERDLKFNPLPWDSTNAWQALGRFVMQEYRKDKMIFAKYRAWSKGDGKFNAVKNHQITRDPKQFILNFPNFLASIAMYGSPDVEEQKTDANDVPMSY